MTVDRLDDTIDVGKKLLRDKGSTKMSRIPPQ